MHPPAETPGASDGGTEPAGLGQAPAEVVLLPSADTGLAAVSEARTRLAAPPPFRHTPAYGNAPGTRRNR